MECKSKVHSDKEDIGVNVSMMKCNSKVHGDKEGIGIGVFYGYLHNYKPQSKSQSGHSYAHRIFFSMMHFYGA